MEILEQCVGKPQQIISAHIKELLKLPSCSGTERSTSLQFVYDKISMHVRGLSALGITFDQYGGLLIPVIMSKLPDEICVRVAKETTSAVWKIKELLAIIKQEVEDRNPKPIVNQEHRYPKPPTASSLASKEDPPRKPHQVQCVYCNELHYSASCEKVTTVNNRRGILIESKRYFKCLMPGHQLSECKHTRGCCSCGGCHHQSICFRSRGLMPNHTHNKESSGLGSTTTQLTTAAASNVKAKGSVLLQTATAIATNEDRQKSVAVRILFNNSSQQSYVTDNLKSKVGLKPTSTENLHLNTFGETVYRNQRCQVLTLPLQNNNDEYVEISVLNFPVICSLIPKRVEVNKYPHLQDLELANRSETSQDAIDIVIGSDYYWDIATGESIQGESGPTPVNSNFGWLHSEPTNSSQYETNVVSNLIISGEAFLNETNETTEINNMLKTLWETESIGIVDEIAPKSQLPTKFKSYEEIPFNGRCYEVGLPWKKIVCPSPTTMECAKHAYDHYITN